MESQEVIPWAIGSDAVSPPADKVAVMADSVVRVLVVVMDYSRDGNKAMKEVGRMLERALPGSPVELRASYGPFEDDEGVASQFDGAVGRLTGPKRIKRVRVHLLTSCAKMLSDAALPDFVIGFGQGGVVPALVRRPLLVELTLQARRTRKSLRFGLEQDQGCVVRQP